jgi:hypothetical protein
MILADLPSAREMEGLLAASERMPLPRVLGRTGARQPVGGLCHVLAGRSRVPDGPWLTVLAYHVVVSPPAACLVCQEARVNSVRANSVRAI